LILLGGEGMPKSYSADLRKRVIEAVASGASRHEVAELFGIAVSTAVKWWQHWRDTGSAAPKSRGGSTSRLEEHTTLILGLVKERPTEADLLSLTAHFFSDREEHRDLCLVANIVNLPALPWAGWDFSHIVLIVRSNGGGKCGSFVSSSTIQIIGALVPRRCV